MLKLHEVVAATLGTALSEAMLVKFDTKLAESSLCFFNIENIPAIRGALPLGVSDVHFLADLSTVPFVSAQALIDQDPVFWDLLPRVNEQ